MLGFPPPHPGGSGLASRAARTTQTARGNATAQMLPTSANVAADPNKIGRGAERRVPTRAAAEQLPRAVLRMAVGYSSCTCGRRQTSIPEAVIASLHGQRKSDCKCTTYVV